MSIKLNKKAYQKLVEEDIQWLEINTKACLEQHHTSHVLRSSIVYYYPDVNQALALLKQPEPSDIELCIPSDCYVVVENEGLKQELDRQAEENKVLQAEIERINDMSYPIQDGENIPEWLAKLVYRGYVNKYGDQQSYERMRERGGFGMAEAVWLLGFIDLNLREIDQALNQETEDK